MNTTVSTTTALTLALAAAVAAAQTPPVAPRIDHPMTWHDTPVNDPWFWLREKDTPPVLAYLNAENAYTEAATRGLAPLAETLYKEMLGRIKQTDLDVPVRRGNWYYYSRTVEGQQYPIYCRRKAAAALAYDDAAPEDVLLDQNELAKGKAYLSIEELRVSDDTKTLLYLADDTGFRQYRLFRKNLATGAVEGPLAERVTGAEWAADNATVFFTTEDAVTKRSDTVWRLPPGGQAQKVFEERDELFDVGIERTKDRRFLAVLSQARDTWETQLLDARQPGAKLQVVLPRQKGHKYAVEHRNGVLYIRTNLDALDFRVVTAPLGKAAPANWKPLVEHRGGVLIRSIDVFRDFIVVAERAAGLDRLRVLDFRTRRWSEIPFTEPTYTASSVATPAYDSATFRYRFQSLVTPPSVFDYDVAASKPVLRKQQEVLGGYDASKYASERLWATARDGTKVPISIVFRRDRPRDGSAPMLLVGYGSYGIPQSATFSSARISLLDRGVAYAIAHIRGGNELGEGWYDDGKLMKKKNTFFDFIDAAEFLVQQKWTAPARLAIEGGSAGGLLMGAVANLRPDLFKAVHSAVPFVDVMNTMMDATLPLTVGEYLEWGNPNGKPAFDYMRSYSPYDNLERKAYPAMLLTSSYNDSQVMYWEPAKYVAKLRTLKTDNNPLLLKMKMEPAGHGGASGRYDALKDRAFEFAWLLDQIGAGR
jgi:oligopeptidase B